MSKHKHAGRLSGSASEVWDSAAQHYDESRKNDSVYISCLQQTVSAVLKANCLLVCLDAGCGTGMSTIELAKECDLVIGADYSYDSLTVLKHKKAKGNIILVHADITRLPFKDGVFDATICANTLQHLKPGAPQDRAIAELQRTTKRTGMLAVSVNHYSKDKQRAGWIKEGKPRSPGIDYIFRFSRADLAVLMPGAVIRGIGFYGFARLPFLGRRLQDPLARMLGHAAAFFGYGHMLLAVARNNNKGTP